MLLHRRVESDQQNAEPQVSIEIMIEVLRQKHSIYTIYSSNVGNRNP